MNWQFYNKFWIALSAAIVVTIPAISSTATEAAWYVTGDEWVQIIAAFVGALGVYQVSNRKKI